MNKMTEKIINTVYITGGLVLLMTVIMSLSSCSTTKMYDIGTGNELSRSRCTGNYIYK